jgi:hypothetical protein
VNTYRATTPAAVAAFSDGVFERDFTPSEEKDWLDSGVLELVPRTYLVRSDNYQVPLGQTFEAAFLVEIEAALVAGGHIERVAPPAVKKPAKPKSD